MSKLSSKIASMSRTVKGVAFAIDPRRLNIEPGYNVRTFNPASNSADAALVADVSRVGVTTPLTVREAAEGEAEGYYVMAGHRRHGAAIAALSGGAMIARSVPVIVVTPGASPLAKLYDLARSNSGEPLTFSAMARLCVKLAAAGEDSGNMAKRLQLVPRMILNYLRIGNAPQDVQDAIESGRIAGSLVLVIARDHTGKVGKGDTAGVAAALESAWTEVRALLASVPVPGKVTAKCRTVSGSGEGEGEESDGAESVSTPAAPAYTAQDMTVRDAEGRIVCDASTEELAVRIAAALNRA